MMREAAISAGLVQSSHAGDRDWRERLRIITYANLSVPFCSTLNMYTVSLKRRQCIVLI